MGLADVTSIFPNPGGGPGRTKLAPTGVALFVVRAMSELPLAPIGPITGTATVPYYRPYYYGWRPGISLWFGV